MARVGYVELCQNKRPGAPLKSDPLRCPLLFSLFRIIQKLATGVNNENKHTNIKLAIINRKTFTKANLVLFNIAILYTFCDSMPLLLHETLNHL